MEERVPPWQKPDDFRPYLKYRFGICMITDRVRSMTGRLCFDKCLSICLSTLGGGGYPGQVQTRGSATPARSSWWGTPARGYPTSGTPCRTWPRGTPAGGYPCKGGTPPQVPPPIVPGQRGTPAGKNRLICSFGLVYRCIAV